MATFSVCCKPGATSTGANPHLCLNPQPPLEDPVETVDLRFHQRVRTMPLIGHLPNGLGVYLARTNNGETTYFVRRGAVSPTAKAYGQARSLTDAEHMRVTWTSAQACKLRKIEVERIIAEAEAFKVRATDRAVEGRKRLAAFENAGHNTDAMEGRKQADAKPEPHPYDPDSVQLAVEWRWIKPESWQSADWHPSHERFTVTDTHAHAKADARIAAMQAEHALLVEALASLANLI